MAFAEAVIGALSTLGGLIDGLTGNSLGSDIMSALTGALVYKDGITETSFGGAQESSWDTWSNGVKSNNQISYTKNTPLGGLTTVDVYGNLILGAPPLFTNKSDPGNRSLINSFVKDMKFVTMVPGLPKYNGGYSEQVMTWNSTYKDQTKSFTDQLNYLKKNGLDSTFSKQDRRYYTFESRYDEYYEYLETMLNTMYIKMGLGKDGSKFNLMTFFNNVEKTRSLQEFYRSPLGFCLQNTAQLSEDISNNPTGTGAEMEGEINGASETFQKLNYLTGMGNVGGNAGQRALKTTNRATGGLALQINAFKDKIIGGVGGAVADTASSWSSAGSKFGTVGKIVGGVIGGIVGASNYMAENDMSAILQQFQVTNGMQVRYPELWSSAEYGKNINMDFEFTSPYGDPLSIFHYVYVPFFALLAFAMPRQADHNGFVSPFFVRADIPGQFTSDMAIISNMSWTKGGAGGNLFTKDGLPRSIHVSITLLDLYRYLAMTKRISFLSANPSYTIFLDSMAGLHAITTDDDDNGKLDEYYRDMLQRVSGDGSTVFRNEPSNTTLTKGRKFGYHTNNMKSMTGYTGKYSTPWMGLL